MSVNDHWHSHLDHYFRERQSLKGLVLLMDIRHPFKEFDETMLHWCSEAELPLHILLTKSDKLKQGAQQNALLSAKRRLDDFASCQTFSSLKKTGVDELASVITSWLSTPDETAAEEDVPGQ